MIPENYPALQIFDRCGDNWITDGWGGRIGLEIPAIESVMRIMRIDTASRPVLLDQIQLIARTIARELQKEREKNAETEG